MLIRKNEIKDIEDDTRLTELICDNHNQYWYWRNEFMEFIDILMSHPRALVTFISSKVLKNMKVAWNYFRTFAEDFEGTISSEERLDWLEKSLLYSTNSSEKVNLNEPGRSGT